MSYLPEDKIYIYVSPEACKPTFPVGSEELDVSVIPIGEEMVQVIGLPKYMRASKLGTTRIKSLELASKLKDRGFVLVISELDGRCLLALVKNSAVWLTKVVNHDDKDKEVDNIKAYVAEIYNQPIERVLTEIEKPKTIEVLNNSNTFSNMGSVNKENKMILITILAVMIIIIIGSLIFYLS